MIEKFDGVEYYTGKDTRYLQVGTILPNSQGITTFFPGLSYTDCVGFYDDTYPIFMARTADREDTQVDVRSPEM